MLGAFFLFYLTIGDPAYVFGWRLPSSDVRFRPVGTMSLLMCGLAPTRMLVLTRSPPCSFGCFVYFVLRTASAAMFCLALSFSPLCVALFGPSLPLVIIWLVRFETTLM